MITLQDYENLAESPDYTIAYWIDLANRYINPAYLICIKGDKNCNHYYIHSVEFNDFGDIDVVRNCCKCHREETKCVFSGTN